MLLISILCRIYVGYFYENTESVFKLNQQELDTYIVALDSIDKLRTTKSEFANAYSSKKSYNSKPELKAFSPNQLNKDEWLGLGFSEAQASAIIKYKDRIGGFYSKEQFQSCFVISEYQFKRLSPYLKFDKHESGATVKSEKTFEKTLHNPPDLNFAGPEELAEINGIGEFTAKRVIDYRNKLGGFTSSQQIYEIPGLDSTRIAVLKTGAIFKSAVYKRININTFDYNELRIHPYIDNNLAKLIVRYRDLHGKYETVESLSKLKLMDEATFLRLSPYLNTD